ncbi:MAG TPA: hypothetical protein PLL75_00990 [Candidatus Omnitrophota bacterium]|nr:hypothetical protein [Candidatus Omnitrophota bacterium]HPS36289.1 hypothetical protein [Candidatus Omnitrophota bacterium]
MKKIISVLLAGLLVTLLGMGYVAGYRAAFRSLKGPKVFQESLATTFRKEFAVSQQEYLDLGWFNYQGDSKDGSMEPTYLKDLLEQEGPGTVKIGIFGGSMTRSGGRLGQDAYTYPGLLQERFKAAGLTRVKVINLGGNRYGLFQEFLLWKLISRSRDLDCVILTIHDIPYDRDLSFQHPFSYGPLHARYILKNDQLTLLSVFGSDRNQASRIYNQVLCPLQYLRYDQGMPMALRAVLPSNLHSRRNPFYYQWSSSSQEELLPIYAAIFKETAAKTKHVIVLAQEDWIQGLRKLTPLPNVSFFAPQGPSSLGSFLYFNEHIDHANAWGNRIVAEELFSYLTGRGKWGFSSLRLTPLLNKAPRGCFTGALSDYEKLSFNAGGRIVAELFADQARPFLKEGRLGRRNVRGFFLLASADPFNVVFLPLSFPIEDFRRVFLTFTENGQQKRIPVGSVRAPSKILGESVFSEGVVLTVRYAGQESYDLLLDVRDPEILKKIPRGAKHFLVTIAGSTVLAASVVDERGFVEKIFGRRAALRLFLKPVAWPSLYLRSPDRFAFDGDPFGWGSGTIDLVLTKKGGREERCPVFSYKHVPVEHVISEPFQGCRSLGFETVSVKGKQEA